MKNLTVFILTLITTSTLAQKLPEGCYGTLNINELLEAPLTGPVVPARTLYCGKQVNGKWTNFTVTTYWRPGSKLPDSIRRQVEAEFKKKIVELKGRDMFNAALAHMVRKISKLEHPRIYQLLTKAGFIRKSVYGDIYLKKAIIDVLLGLQLRDDLANRSSKVMDAIVYYGLKQGQKLGLIKDNSDIGLHSEKLSGFIKAKGSYEKRYIDISNHLKLIEWENNPFEK